MQIRKKIECKANPTFQMKYNSSFIGEWGNAHWFTYPQYFTVKQFPLQLDIELNTTCNIRCKKCFHSNEFIEPQRMQMELVKKLIREGSYKGLESIKLQYRGEPLMYNGLCEIIRYAKQWEINEVMFNSNGTLLTQDLAKELVDSGLDKIIFSIDSYKKKVYEDLHRGASFDSVIANIIYLKVHRTVQRRIKPIIRIQQVIQDENIKEGEKYVEFFKTIADQVAIEEYIDYSNTESIHLTMKDWACPQLWQRLFIWADGSVHPCCSLTSMSVGNIHKNTIEEIWSSIEMKTIRDFHKRGDSHAILMCLECPMRKHEYSKRLKNE